MILKNNLYIVKSSDIDKNCFEIELNKDCFIYKAHFPEQPVTPGVCIIQIAGELFEELIGTPVELSSVLNAKFLSVINPSETSRVSYNFKKIESIEEQSLIKVSVVVADKDKTFSKLSILYKQK